MTNVESGTNFVAESNTPYLTPCKSSSNFEELALPLFDTVCNFAHWLARNHADAEDLVQEAYLKAFRSFAAFEPGSDFRAWIFRILKNTFLSSRTSAQHRHTVFLDFDEELTRLPSNFLDPTSVLMDKARLDAVQAATQRLPIIFRDVLILCDLEEFSYREAAQALSIPVGTVMSRLSRARKAVRESVQNMHQTVARTYGLEAAKN